MDKKGEGAGVARQHPLPARQHGTGIHADAMPHAHGPHVRNAGGFKGNAPLRGLQLGHNPFQIRHAFRQHHHRGNAALQNARRKPRLLQRTRLQSHTAGDLRIGMGKQIFHGNDLPASGQHHILAGGKAAGRLFLVGLGVQGDHGHGGRVARVAAGQPGHTRHMRRIHNHPVHAGFKSQSHVIPIKGNAFYINAAHLILPERPELRPRSCPHARCRAEP